MLQIKIREAFCDSLKFVRKKYNLPYFFLTSFSLSPPLLFLALCLPPSVSSLSFSFSLSVGRRSRMPVVPPPPITTPPPCPTATAREPWFISFARDGDRTEEIRYEIGSTASNRGQVEEICLVVMGDGRQCGLFLWFGTT